MQINELDESFLHKYAFFNIVVDWLGDYCSQVHITGAKMNAHADEQNQQRNRHDYINLAYKIFGEQC